ncbi:MAG: type II toxin-antitoxin system HicA family toxin [Bacteroidales bacterium]|nr:type II toxin-antitoxin system HicA family toxin [Bacteroidales bacterium]
MGTKEKLIDRLKSLPTDFTFDEASSLLHLFGYKKENKGKTSGSRVMFIDEHNRKILLHRPHPGNTLKKYALNNIIAKLIRNKNI